MSEIQLTQVTQLKGSLVKSQSYKCIVCVREKEREDYTTYNNERKREREREREDYTTHNNESVRDRITTAHEVCTGIPSRQTLGNQPQQTYQLHANISVSLQCLQRPELMILNVSKATNSLSSQYSSFYHVSGMAARNVCAGYQRLSRLSQGRDSATFSHRVMQRLCNYSGALTCRSS